MTQHSRQPHSTRVGAWSRCAPRSAARLEGAGGAHAKPSPTGPRIGVPAHGPASQPRASSASAMPTSASAMPTSASAASQSAAAGAAAAASAGLMTAHGGCPGSSTPLATKSTGALRRLAPPPAARRAARHAPARPRRRTWVGARKRPSRARLRPALPWLCVRALPAADGSHTVSASPCVRVGTRGWARCRCRRARRGACQQPAPATDRAASALQPKRPRKRTRAPPLTPPTQMTRGTASYTGLRA